MVLWTLEISRPSIKRHRNQNNKRQDLNAVQVQAYTQYSPWGASFCSLICVLWRKFKIGNKAWTLPRLCTHKRHPYLVLTGELWVSYVSTFGKTWPRDWECIASAKIFAICSGFEHWQHTTHNSSYEVSYMNAVGKNDREILGVYSRWKPRVAMMPLLSSLVAT